MLRLYNTNDFFQRYSIEDGYDISAVSGATDYAVLQAWDMTHGRQDEPPRRALQHSALHRDPGAAGRDRPYDNIVGINIILYLIDIVLIVPVMFNHTQK